MVIDLILQDHFDGNPTARQFDIYSTKLCHDLVTSNETTLKEERRKKEEENTLYIGSKLEQKIPPPDEPPRQEDKQLSSNGDPIRTFNVKVPKIDEVYDEDHEDDIMDDEDFMTPLQPDESDDSENENQGDDE